MMVAPSLAEHVAHHEMPKYHNDYRHLLIFPTVRAATMNKRPQKKILPTIMMTPLFTPKRAFFWQLLLAYHVSYTIAFPSMLVESKGGCMVELSTEEVIMNNPVVAWQDSSRQDLYVAIVTNDGAYTKDDIVLSLDIKEYKVTVVNPGDALVDVQYALETTKGASFVDGGCDGKRRTHGRLSDKTQHTLVIDSIQQDIQIVAGWAGGHEAVQLTQALVLKPAKVVDNTKDATDAADKQEKSGHVLGVQVVDKHEPKDVDARKVEEADVIVGQARHEEKKDIAADADKNDKPANAAEDAHKNALNEEIKILKDDVDKLKASNQEEKGVVKDEMVQEAIRQKDSNVQATDADKERIARFKREYAKKHEKPKGDIKHGEAVQRFKDAYAAKHGKLDEKASAEEVKHADIIKRFKESFKEKHGNQDKRRYHNTAGNVLKHMHESMRHDVTRRKGNPSFAERVKRRYNDPDEQSLFEMSSYVYGIIFFVLANVCIIQVCLQIAKQDKGRRHE